MTACGGSQRAPEKKQPLEVAANPPGFTFDHSTTVALVASRPAKILYTLNGDDPTGPTAQVFDQPFELTDSTLVSFIATSNDGVWSPARAEQYVPAPEMNTQPAIIPRGLLADENNHFFAPRDGDPTQTAVFHVRSIGIETVHIQSIQINDNPHGTSFYEDGVFQFVGDVQPLDLPSGQTLTLTVSYTPTQTLRSAAIVIQSDEQRDAGGLLIIELWGRIFNN
jgi:hypothetical protein